MSEHNGAPVKASEAQRALLDAAARARGHLGFEEALAAAGRDGLWTTTPRVLQLNMGSLCNLRCRHCHVDAGPDRHTETMLPDVVDACLRFAARDEIRTVDLTGGAPELHPDFERIVEQAAGLGKHVIDRCNLAVLLLPRLTDLPAFLSRHRVEVVGSLPHWRRGDTDAVRGAGTHAQSIEALRRLNAAGYGQGDPHRTLTLVTNPAGAVLAGDQRAMEAEWKAALGETHGVTFDRMIAMNNMPIARFLAWLVATGNLSDYLARLVDGFNPATVAGLMCHDTLSVGWDGQVYDCDFNQMLGLAAIGPDGRALRAAELDRAALGPRRVRTGVHCYGCTAGAGSSCGGATAVAGEAA